MAESALQSISSQRVSTPAPVTRRASSSAGSLAQLAKPNLRLNGGEPLPNSVRGRLEQGFNTNLSTVRVHSDDNSREAAQQVGARAFTLGPNIVLGPRERPDDLPLMAHEVAHVIQQRSSQSIQAFSSKAGGGSLEAEAHAASSAVVQGQGFQVQGQASAQIQKEGDGVLDSLGLGGLSLESAAMALVDRFAPTDLATTIREIMRQGMFEWVKEKVSSAIETVFNSLMAPVRSITGVGQALSGHFTSLLNWMREAAAKIAKGDCSSISEAAQKIHDVFIGFTAPIVDRIKQLSSKVSDFFNRLWNRFGAPIWDFLRDVGGRVWDKIQQVANDLWNKTKPIRDKLAAAWTWIKNKLGVGDGPEGQNGLLQWVQTKATEVWNWIKPKIEPYKKQLLVVAGILLLFSPAGPFLVLGAAVTGLLYGIGWIRRFMRDRKEIVKQRGLLQGVILPSILGAVNRVSSFLQDKARMILDKLAQVVSSLGGMVSLVGASILSFAVGAMNWLLNQFQNLVTWASEGLLGVVNWITQGLERLRRYAQPVLDVLDQIGRVIADIMELPFLIAGRLWNAIPACIRDPFVDFFVPRILKYIPIFRDISTEPSFWAQVAGDIQRIIRQIFRDHDLLGAMKTAFGIVLKVLKVPVDLVVTIWNKIGQASDAVFEKPMEFLKSVGRAMAQGFKQFFKNALSHVGYGIRTWLLGPLQDAGVELPQSWTDFRGIFRMVVQLLGITLDHVFELMEKRIDPKKVKRLRQVVGVLTGAWEWLKVAMEEGPEGLWKKLTEQLKNLGTMVLDMAIDWVMKRVIAYGSARLATYLDPTGIMAVVNTIVTIYQAIQTVMEYLRSILETVNRVLDGILDLTRGVIKTGADALEGGLRMIMPIVISFVARWVGLGGLGDKIREMIENIRQKVDDGILWLIDKGKAAVDAVLRVVGSAIAAVRNWWQQRKDFSTPSGHPHSIYFSGTGKNARLLLASNDPEEIRSRIQKLKPQLAANADKSALAQAEPIVTIIEGLVQRQGDPNAPVTTPSIEDQIAQHLETLKEILKKVELDPNDLPETKISFATIPGVNSAGSRASVVVANPLTEKAGNTTGSSNVTATDIPGYFQTPTTPINYRVLQYVRMHLVSHRLHGPGNVAGNLVMAPTGINTGAVLATEKTVEGLLKQKRVLRFTASVNYFTSSASFADFPSQVNFGWVSIDNKQPAINGNHPQPIPLPNFSPQAQQDLNTAIKAKLQEMLGVADLANEVFRMRPFANFSAFKTQMMKRFPPQPIGNIRDTDFRRLIPYLLQKVSIILINGKSLSSSDIAELNALREDYNNEPGRRKKI